MSHKKPGDHLLQFAYSINLYNLRLKQNIIIQSLRTPLHRPTFGTHRYPTTRIHNCSVSYSCFAPQPGFRHRRNLLNAVPSCNEPPYSSQLCFILYPISNLKQNIINNIQPPKYPMQYRPHN